MDLKTSFLSVLTTFPPRSLHFSGRSAVFMFFECDGGIKVKVTDFEFFVLNIYSVSFCKAFDLFESYLA